MTYFYTKLLGNNICGAVLESAFQLSEPFGTGVPFVECYLGVEPGATYDPIGGTFANQPIDVSNIIVSSAAGEIALIRANILDMVDAAIALQPAEVQVRWKRAANLCRSDAAVNAVLSSAPISYTQAQIDALFLEAKLIQNEIENG